ncbi:hypothetical protein [Gordonia sputi]|uniref:hypothetical protein n=1 Tax=Gordonia sputi TaxID=36823 RepID=UPI000586BD4D|nr:hypothetical protein [Gordonia sputi]NKY95891.1 hypothetical protein [Gordonia sputi]
MEDLHDIKIEKDIDSGDIVDDESMDDLGSEHGETIGGDSNNDAAASVLLADETQLADFYLELKYRSEILSRIPSEDPTELLGFSKEAMTSYLEPIVLVDGQHRLRGAVAAASALADNADGREQQADLVDSGVDPGEAYRQVEMARARVLPVSLLLNASPSEHVFQFVVVNQKATPMGKALLGTIVSTSLSRDELEPVAERLKDAGIRLEDSQAVAYLTRASESPFKGLVQTGVRGDQKDALGWNVLKGLVTIFRELKGGKLYGSNNDYADMWKKRHLEQSGFVADAEGGLGEMFAYWSRPDGPWRDVFIRFFTLIRDKFGAPDDPSANNGWGATTSNLFNMVSLTILSADYFQFLIETRQTLSDVTDVNRTFDEWLNGVNSSYFARDWNLGGLKKAQRPVQEQWAKVWTEYRKNPERLPRNENYRPSGR